MMTSTQTKGISILGSTGSIGKQALAVIALHPERFSAVALVAHSNAPELFEQVRRFRPKLAGLVIPPPEIPEDLRDIEWVFSEDCLRIAATLPDAEAVLVAVVGFAGLVGVLAAMDAGKRVLLANKEPLVGAGRLVMARAKEKGVPILPVDSEHSAIFQCLQGAGGNQPTEIILTASGGPFRTWSREQMQAATLEETLRHPNWDMGPKITVDSATMVNKALEIIEARWLFDMPPEAIRVSIHPQSIVHSMVAFADGALLAQLGTPDMRLPILYAMAYPERLDTGAPPLTPSMLVRLDFEEPDFAKFPALRLAYEALAAGDMACSALNAANEVAVAALLAGRIAYRDIVPVIEKTLESTPSGEIHTLEQALAADGAARRLAEQTILSAPPA